MQLQHLKLSGVRVSVEPVGSGTGLVNVLDGGDEVLVNPGVVRITNTVLGANLANLGGNEGVPGTGHAREQVVLDLEVEPSGQSSGNKATIGRRGFDLRLEPTRSFALSVSCAVGGITVDLLKVVREGKQNSKSQTGRSSHDQDVSNDVGVPSLVHEWSNNVGVNVENAQTNGILSALSDVRVFHVDSNFFGTALLQIEDLAIENRR